MQEAKTRDGIVISLGDEVETNWSPKCDGVIFVVCEITPYDICESKFMLNVHVKGSPDRKLKASSPLGFDTNHFKKINQP